jgi:hypothetical protein
MTTLLRYSEKQNSAKKIYEHRKDYLEKLIRENYPNMEKEDRDYYIQILRDEGKERMRASTPFIKPISEEMMKRVFDSNDSVLSKCCFQNFKQIVDCGEVPPLYMQQFIANMLVSAAENPANARSILGLSEKTRTYHRDIIIAVYVYRLILKEKAHVDGRTFYGDEDGTKAATFTTEGDQVLRMASFTLHSQKTMLKTATF